LGVYTEIYRKEATNRRKCLEIICAVTSRSINFETGVPVETPTGTVEAPAGFETGVPVETPAYRSQRGRDRELLSKGGGGEFV
jgi:hypothetical protein